MVALIAHGGEAATEAWARGVVGNLREAPEGGDTDQAKSVAAGECAVAVSNIYCRARLMASERVEECNLTKRIGVVWPNQAGHGTRIDFSGGGMVRTSPHPATAIAFLEYLVSDEAQRFLANANNELPAVPGVEIANVELEKLG